MTKNLGAQMTFILNKFVIFIARSVSMFKKVQKVKKVRNENMVKEGLMVVATHKLLVINRKDKEWELLCKNTWVGPSFLVVFANFTS